MKRIIHPHIGAEFSTGLHNKKILILGESSYHPKGQPQDVPNHTKNLAQDAVGYDEGKGYWNKSRFYTRIARMFGFNAANFSERKMFWNRVSYYNFLQVILTKPRQFIPPEEWVNGIEPFKQTINEIEPDIVVSFSKRMWKFLPKKKEYTVNNPYNTFCQQSIFKADSDKEIHMLGLYHPTSFGFKWQNEKCLIEEFIKS
jgi:hypothetical protein